MAAPQGSTKSKSKKQVYIPLTLTLSHKGRGNFINSFFLDGAWAATIF